MNKSALLHCLLVFCLALGIAPASAQEGAFQSWEDIAVTYWVPCAAGGAGEWVAMTGQVHLVANVAAMPSGGQHSAEQWNIVMSGAGLTSGTVYHGTWLQHISRNTRGAQYEYHERYALTMVGRGLSGDFRVEGVLRFVYDAKGMVRVDIENGRVVCR